MKVLSHEDDVLKNGFGTRSPASSESTTHLRGAAGRLEAGAGLRILEPDCRAESVRHDELDLHLVQPAASMADAAELARQMGDIFLHGMARAGKAPRAKKPDRRKLSGRKIVIDAGRTEF